MGPKRSDPCAKGVARYFYSSRGPIFKPGSANPPLASSAFHTGESSRHAEKRHIGDVGKNSATRSMEESREEEVVGAAGAQTECIDLDEMIEVEPILPAALIAEITKTKRRDYELARHFKENWAAKLPWAEMVTGENGKMSQVRCIVCTKVEGREKLLVPKIDSLHKHVGRRKAREDILVQGKITVHRGEFYYLKENQHIKNEKTYSVNSRFTILDAAARINVQEKKKKRTQFLVANYLCARGRPMTDYEGMGVLLPLLNTPEVPRKHWSDNSGWGIAEALCHVVQEKTKEVLKASCFFALSADEVTSIDHQSWVPIHVYTCQNWRRVPILLCLQQVVEGADAAALRTVLLDAVQSHGGLKVADIAQKLVSIGADGAAVFQGSKTGVITQFKEKDAPYMMGIHCVAHRTNLVVGCLSNLPMVMKVEDLVQGIYSFLTTSPKRQLEFQMLAEILGTPGGAMLRNNKTRWISLKEPMERVRMEYKSLLVKMAQDAPSAAGARSNLSLLLDVQTLLFMSALGPLLSSVNSLIKYAQGRSVYVTDFVAALKSTQAEIYEMYVDTTLCFKPCHFQDFNDLIEDHTHVISFEWIPDVNSEIEYLSYRVGDKTYPAHYLDGGSGEQMPVSQEDLVHVISQVKRQATEAAELMIAQFDVRFPDTDLMCALGVVYPQYWLNPTCDEEFPMHLAVIKSHFCLPKSVTTKDGKRQIIEPLNTIELEQMQSLFKMTMRSNARTYMEALPEDVHPLTKMWSKLAQNPFLLSKLEEWFKLAEIAIVAVLGSVEDERTFSTFKFMKDRIRNRLGQHLDCSVKLYVQDFWTVGDFPYADAINYWETVKDRLCVDQ